VALSMEEQRILDEMERNLAADDPRLASRLGSFGQQRLPTALSSQRARTVGGLLALALIAALTIMMFVLSPFANDGRSKGQPSQRPPSVPATSPHQPSATGQLGGNARATW
jgi:hypothetical protein